MIGESAVSSSRGVVGFDDSADEEKKSRYKKISLCKKSGGFQSMGLSFPLLKAVQKRGYKVPTPIQRKTIPLALEGRDVVAMARTGSGKTACFLIPMLEKLRERGTQSAIRALILTPTRELALQTVRFMKELGRFTGLRHCLILGGDSMESQFSSLHAHPDIVIATPGRFFHICVEMELSLSTVQILILDEADRLFEMGFGEQVKEILTRLPESRQTLLLSATLPKVLVEFARAGLSDPVLIRLDVESKLPESLEASFLLCRSEEKPAALLALLKHVVPSSAPTIIFAATKHHVEYIHSLLDLAGFRSTFIYSDLDNSARKINAAKFQTGQCRIMVVTDVAARGIDIPSLDYVINYNFPAKPKLFVHRVGRCARAGRRGWALSLVGKDELCYLLDIHLFLCRPVSTVAPGTVSTDSRLIGSLPRSLIEEQCDRIITWETQSADLVSGKKTSINAYKHYLKCRTGASRESVRRSKQIDMASVGVHSLLSKYSTPGSSADNSAIVASLQTYRPAGTVFEIGQSSRSLQYTVMKKKRETHKAKILSHKKSLQDSQPLKEDTSCSNLESCNAEDIGKTFSSVVEPKRRNTGIVKSSVDSTNYIPYRPADFHTEEGLAVNNFHRDASAVGLDLSADTESGLRSSRAHKVWDKKKKKMVGVDDKRKSKILSESGKWIDASFKSGRYKQWKDKTKVPDSTDNPEPMSTELGAPHWSRHNMKVKQKSAGVGIRSADQIVKQRIAKEKKKRRNGRKKK